MEIADNLVQALRAVEARTFDDQWNANRAVMRAAFVFLVPGHELAAMVADENEDGVVGKMLLLQNLSDSSHRNVDCLAAAVIVRQLRLPVSRERPQIRGHKGILKTLRDPIRRNKAFGVILEMGFQLRDKEQEWLVMWLAQKSLRAISHEVNAELVLKGDLPVSYTHLDVYKRQ